LWLASSPKTLATHSMNSTTTGMSQMDAGPPVPKPSTYSEYMPTTGLT
jgi:hypothetical protein